MKLRIVTLSILSHFIFSIATQAQVAYPRFQKHMVLEGETAKGICEHFQVSLEDFCLQNDFPKDVKLKAGQVVLIRQLKAGEQEIVETPLTTKKEAVKPSITSTPKETAPVKKTETPVAKKEEKPVSKEKPKPAAEPAVTKKETSSEPFVVPPPSTKAVEVGPGGTKYNVSKNDYHIVAKGQTFFRIALIYGLSVEELKQLNGLSNTNIEIGQKLKVRK